VNDWSRYLIPDGQGGMRVAGCEPRVHDIGRQPVGATGEYLPVWGTVDDCPILPDEQLTASDPLRPWEWDDIDQNGYPSCCLCAWANCIELFLALNGRAKTKLDWYKAWHKLSGGRGGVDIGTALQFIMDTGYPLADGSGVLHVTEAYEAPSQKGFLSGLKLGYPGVFGHDAHAECGASITDASLNFDVRNSWGNQGRWHVMAASQIDIKRYGAYLLREVELRPIDTSAYKDSV
jgi:hypothetical protein